MTDEDPETCARCGADADARPLYGIRPSGYCIVCWDFADEFTPGDLPDDIDPDALADLLSRIDDRRTESQIVPDPDQASEGA